MKWIYYLLEANLYLVVFYAFYRMFLHKETFYTLNRCYLILTTLLAFSLPLVQFGYLFVLFGFRRPANQLNVPLPPQEIVKADYQSAEFLLPAIYLIVALVLLSILVLRITRIVLAALRAKKQKYARTYYLELHGEQTAFSFFGLLFINPNISEKEAVIRHELVHIHQKHSIDVLFFEMVQIIGWFNPVAYLYQKDIKLIHEYIADELTTRVAIPKHEYAMLLIQHSFGAPSNSLTNQIFNQSVLKKRISMLNKQKSGVAARLKLLLALPIAGGMICMSTMAFTKDYGVLDLYPVNAGAQDTIRKTQSTHKAKVPVVTNIKRKTLQPPPPPNKVDQVKFPPPIVTINKKSSKRKSVSTKKVDQVKFPPPIVKNKTES